jgi:hypothetical protein
MAFPAAYRSLKVFAELTTGTADLFFAAPGLDFFLSFMVPPCTPWLLLVLP